MLMVMVLLGLRAALFMWLSRLCLFTLDSPFHWLSQKCKLVFLVSLALFSSFSIYHWLRCHFDSAWWCILIFLLRCFFLFYVDLLLAYNVGLLIKEICPLICVLPFWKWKMFLLPAYMIGMISCPSLFYCSIHWLSLFQCKCTREHYN